MNPSIRFMSFYKSLYYPFNERTINYIDSFKGSGYRKYLSLFTSCRVFEISITIKLRYFECSSILNPHYEEKNILNIILKAIRK